MYRGFNLTLSEWESDDWRRAGLELFSGHNKIIKESLKVYLDENNTINGTLLEQTWFPQIKADVFISHSHVDRDIALSLAGWLKITFNLVAFIDSCVWSNSDALQKDLDNSLCRNDNPQTYNYDKRNRSTAHVHMMLMAALAKMIDRCECLMFLNTPASTVSEGISDGVTQTASPWIYSEINLSHLIRKRLPVREKEYLEKAFSLNENETKIIYELDLTHLAKIDAVNLHFWKLGATMRREKNALDILYEFVPY